MRRASRLRIMYKRSGLLVSEFRAPLGIAQSIYSNSQDGALYASVNGIYSTVLSNISTVQEQLTENVRKLQKKKKKKKKKKQKIYCLK